MQRHDKFNLETAIFPRRTYLAVVKAVPITTIDLIIRNHKNEILLGWRKNQPAKNSWFLPGGRLLKNERVEDGLSRIYRAELGVDLAFKQPKFLGVFELFFDTNFAGVKGIGTHNISLAYEIKIGSALSNAVLHTGQHSRFHWFTLKDLIKSPEVHKMVKAYFAQKKS